MMTTTYCYTTHEDGYCEYDDAETAVAEATYAAEREREQVTVYAPDGTVHQVVGAAHPTHSERCTEVERYGFED